MSFVLLSVTVTNTWDNQLTRKRLFGAPDLKVHGWMARLLWRVLWQSKPLSSSQALEQKEEEEARFHSLLQGHIPQNPLPPLGPTCKDSSQWFHHETKPFTDQTRGMSRSLIWMHVHFLPGENLASWSLICCRHLQGKTFISLGTISTSRSSDSLVLIFFYGFD